MTGRGETPGRRHHPRGRLSGHGQDGSGLVSTWAGFLVFLTLLLLAVQVVYDLYATSAVTAAAFDAARLVAGGQGGADSEGRAEEHARQVLGRYAERVHFDWAGSDAETVRLHVHADNPSFLLPDLAASLPFTHVDRTIRVRVERFR